MAHNAGPVSCCRYCGSDDMRQVLSLGAQPPSNSFIRAEQIASERRYPLDMVRCGTCSLVQLGYTVHADEIFDDYHYLSSASEALREHYRELALDLSHRFDLRAGQLVVDIGCNDGILLEAFDASMARVGVEPSRVADVARASGLEVVRAFFASEIADSIVRSHGRASLITATNVFAHVDPIDDIVKGVKRLLSPDGVFVIEASYLLDLVDLRLFDTIYHEHIFYLALTPMVPYLARHGLNVIDVERVPFGASGPAFRVYCAPSGSTRARSASVGAFLAAEEAWGVSRDEPFARFAAAVHRVRAGILRVLDEVRAGGAVVGAYGAPAKGNTLLNYLGLGPSQIALVAERNRLKHGKLTPGTHIPVVNEERFLEVMPPYALLLAWNYLDFFLRKSPYIQRGGRFIVPLPEVKIVP